MTGALFYVALAAATIGSWLWFVRQVRDKQAQDALEELRVNLEKLRLEIALALLPALERMANAFAAVGVSAREAEQKLREAARCRK